MSRLAKYKEWISHCFTGEPPDPSQANRLYHFVNSGDQEALDRFEENNPNGYPILNEGQTMPDLPPINELDEVDVRMLEVLARYDREWTFKLWMIEQLKNEPEGFDFFSILHPLLKKRFEYRENEPRMLSYLATNSLIYEDSVRTNSFGEYLSKIPDETLVKAIRSTIGIKYSYGMWIGQGDHFARILETLDPPRLKRLLNAWLPDDQSVISPKAAEVFLRNELPGFPNRLVQSIQADSHPVTRFQCAKALFAQKGSDFTEIAQSEAHALIELHLQNQHKNFAGCLEEVLTWMAENFPEESVQWFATYLDSDCNGYNSMDIYRIIIRQCSQIIGGESGKFLIRKGLSHPLEPVRKFSSKQASRAA